jgi:hypothetical protein
MQQYHHLSQRVLAPRSDPTTLDFLCSCKTQVDACYLYSSVINTYYDLFYLTASVEEERQLQLRKILLKKYHVMVWERSVPLRRTAVKVTLGT